jgi:hypothetical protein
VPDELVCTGKDRALVCDSVKWVPVACKGTRGCTRSDSEECDDTVASEGDPCTRNPPLDYACSPDRTTGLVCKDGTFTVWRRCRGPDACQVIDGRNVRCDTSVGEPGDPCTQHGTYACSPDRRAMLVCDGSSLALASTCRGPQGCRARPDTHRVDCDETVALEGDPCADARSITCAVDRKSELVCAGNRFAKKRECRRTDCRIEDTKLFCD